MESCEAPNVGIKGGTLVDWGLPSVVPVVVVIVMVVVVVEVGE